MLSPGRDPKSTTAQFKQNCDLRDEGMMRELRRNTTYDVACIDG